MIAKPSLIFLLQITAALFTKASYAGNDYLLQIRLKGSLPKEAKLRATINSPDLRPATYTTAVPATTTPDASIVILNPDTPQQRVGVINNPCNLWSAAGADSTLCEVRIPVTDTANVTLLGEKTGNLTYGLRVTPVGKQTRDAISVCERPGSDNRGCSIELPSGENRSGDTVVIELESGNGNN